MEQKPEEKIQSDLIKGHWNKEAGTYYTFVPGERAKLPTKFEEFYQKHKAEWREALDIGCGPGKFLIPMLQDGLNVTGFDIADNMLKSTELNMDLANKSEIPEDHLKGNVRLVEGESKNLSAFPDGSFNLVFAKGSIHHNNWAGILRSLKEVKRVLKSGGIFVFQCRSTKDAALLHSEPISDAGTDGGITAKDLSGKVGVFEHYFSKAELEKLAKENGFEVVVEPEERIKSESGKEIARWWVVYKKI